MSKQGVHNLANKAEFDKAMEEHKDKLIVLDCFATWCGPCKVISPVFEQLASAESKPGKIIFCKVDVDAQREIAGNYGVSAYVPA